MDMEGLVLVDWEQLSRDLGALSDDGHTESGGEETGARAIASILGRDTIESAVRYYVSGGAGFETVRSVLQLLRPREAMEECMRIHDESERREERVSAIELLRSIGDRSALQWLDLLLKDSDPAVQQWAARLVDQLVMTGLMDQESAESWARRFEVHANADVREVAVMIRRAFTDS
jgi:hypothetical protein